MTLDDDEIDFDEPSESSVTEPIEAGIFDQIIHPLKKGDGFRHLWLGDSGQGKTVANDALIRYILKKRAADVILTVDDKSSHEVQYKSGLLRVNPEHLRLRPPKDDENRRHVVFRGIAATKVPGPDVDELIFDVCTLAWELVRASKCKVVVNVDELADATNGNQAWKRPEVGSLYRKGRGVGISVLATTQLPQTLPREAFGLPETIGIFRMTTREVFYLVKYHVLSAEEAEQITDLKVGEFRLYCKAKPDGSKGGLDPRVFKLVI